MKNTVLLSFLFFTIAILQSCLNNELHFKNAYVIENVNIIDPLEGIQNNMTVVIKESKIDQLFKADNVKLSPKNTIYDGTNKYLIPGLWDAHIHYAFETSLAKKMNDLFLSHGVTSVRDTGGPIDFCSSLQRTLSSKPQNFAKSKNCWTLD